ncbi:hypothetical protein [Streptomyces sp. NPDC090798]|uniref:hypothetical protein n=1 Tax=Streptomyces sp. NPDC090798 TaxID=3365968 RepID=UPI003829B366
MSSTPQRGYRHESEECLAALTDAAISVQTALRRLSAAPNADGLTKNAIEIQLTEIRRGLDDLTRRLDELPTA